MMSSFLQQFVRSMSTTPGGPAAPTKPSELHINTSGGERKLKQSELDFMKLIEKQNFQRVKKLRLQKNRNNITGLIVGGTVISIYLYSMLAVKQEKFLDDFNEPQKVATVE